MSWVAVGVGTLGVGMGTSAVGSFMGASKTSKEAKKMREMLERSANEVDAYAQEYVGFLTDLDMNFDPLNVEDAFNSLYEAVIQPMERDFDENVLPGIQAAYSGGVMGASAGLSGASQEAESNARQKQAETKAQLRYQERDKAIGRNYLEYDRRANLGQARLSAQTMAPLMRAQQAPQIYSAATDAIGAQTAAFNQLGSGLSNMGQVGLSAYQTNRQVDQTDSLIKILNKKNGVID